MDEPVEEGGDGGNTPSDDENPQLPRDRGTAETSRPETPELDENPLPDELTGRASKTSEDLTTLFKNETPEHLADGFRGASGDDPDDVRPESTLTSSD
jgi:hypothetical protein